jgi:hypothetical protein
VGIVGQLALQQLGIGQNHAELVSSAGETD